MADTRLYTHNHQLDLNQILQAAQQRWLRTSEICEILRNYTKYELRPDPPIKPPAGSLFLYDRRVLRYFRKDGHHWRKKKDGKTVKEAHEKLKEGSVDVLHCYYAHGEDNENFQRRCYWLLDQQLDNIVLVHYREVKEGYKSGIPRLGNADSESQLKSPQSIASFCLEKNSFPDPTVQISHASDPNSVDWNKQTVSSRCNDVDPAENPGTSFVQTDDGSLSYDSSLRAVESGFLELSRYPSGSGFAEASINHGSSLLTWVDGHSSGNEPKFYFEQPSTADFLSNRLIGRLDADSSAEDVSHCATGLMLISQTVVQDHGTSMMPSQLHADSQAIDTSIPKFENHTQVIILKNDDAKELAKLDSFGRWMNKEIGGDCDDSLMASDSGNYWGPFESENDDKEVSSLSHHMQLDTDSVGPSLSQEQLYSISDFAPDWAYSGEETKVLIIGTFLGGNNHYIGVEWSCMFGEIEVSAEVVMGNVIKCQVPFHAPGRVPFYITCSNRLACSEVREFEYRENKLRAVSPIKYAPEDGSFLIRLAKLLCSGIERKWLNCSIVNCEKCKLKNDICSLKVDCESSWGKNEALNSRDLLIQNLLKDKLYVWLVCKKHEMGKGLHTLDDKGLGIIHLAAAVGYEWAIGPIVAAGVSLNFRDLRGRTALHWASIFGREETVVTLIRLGAASGAVDDPTRAIPGGQTAADMASSRGYKGIAGYLAEADLTSHLQALSVNKNVVANSAAAIAAENATESAVQSVLPSKRTQNEQCSLRGSLAAFRKSAYAAALIQDDFRARSFHQRQVSESSSGDISESSVDLVALGSLNKIQNMSHFKDYLHSAAVRIQQKYRGWKRRNDFLKIRRRIVQIQAHVRGHQVRKKYKKVVWSVGIVEKAILRWRRKSCGLRGFRAEETIDSVAPVKNDEYDFLRIGRQQKFAGVQKALARVQSMVRHPEARDQYMRLAAKFEKLSNEDNSEREVKSSEKE